MNKSNKGLLLLVLTVGIRPKLRFFLYIFIPAASTSRQI